MASRINFVKSKTKSESLRLSLENPGGLYFPLDSGSIILDGLEYGSSSSNLLLSDMSDGRIINPSFDDMDLSQLPERKTGDNKLKGYAITKELFNAKKWDILGWNSSNVNPNIGNPTLTLVTKDCIGAGLPVNLVTGSPYIPNSRRALRMDLYDNSTQFGLVQNLGFTFPEPGFYSLTMDYCNYTSPETLGKEGKWRIYLVSQEPLPNSDSQMMTVPIFGSEVMNFSASLETQWKSAYVPIRLEGDKISKTYYLMVVVQPGQVGDFIILDNIRLNLSRLHNYAEDIFTWGEF